MIHSIAKFFLCVAIVVAVPAATYAQNDRAAICAAFANGNYNRALALTRAAFAKIKSGTESAALIKAILSCAPLDQAGAIVVAAVEANCDLAETTISAAISNVSQEERLAILSALNLAFSQNPGLCVGLAGFISDLLASVEGVAPTTTVLGVPTFNPANSSTNGIFISPATPGAQKFP
jgi:hypothetical protein